MHELFHEPKNNFNSYSIVRFISRFDIDYFRLMVFNDKFQAIISNSESVTFFNGDILRKNKDISLFHEELYLVSYPYLRAKGKLAEFVLGLIGEVDIHVKRGLAF